MFNVTVLTPPAGVPVLAEDARTRHRLNHTIENAALAEFLAGAVDLFESDTGRPVLATAYRQDLDRWPCGGVVVLGRGGVTTVTAVRRYLADGTTEDLAADRWRANLVTAPARVVLAELPDPVETAAGIPVSPVGCVEFVAGWATPAAVPPLVRTALLLMAGHHYRHRESTTEKDLRETPDGWRRVVTKYRTGLRAHDWNQGAEL